MGAAIRLRIDALPMMPFDFRSGPRCRFAYAGNIKEVRWLLDVGIYVGTDGEKDRLLEVKT